MPTSTLTALLLLLSTALGPSSQPGWADGSGPGPQFDCNGNGIEDAVDIAFGTSSDVDQNGVPDECERG